MFEELQDSRVGAETSCVKPKVRHVSTKSLSMLHFDVVKARSDHVIAGKLKSPSISKCVLGFDTDSKFKALWNSVMNDE